MAAVTGYFDDSRTDGLVLTLAGYVGGEDHWKRFEGWWGKVLQRYEVPYFHMKEFGDPDGPYKKWLPYKDHQKQLAGFLGGLATAIGRSRLFAFGSIVRMKDLERFNQDHGLSLEAYSIAAYSNMIHMGRQHPGVIVSAIFDRIERVSSKLERAGAYASSDKYYPGVANLVQPIPLNKGLTFRNVPAIQAADFAAWEIRKHHLNQNEWWESGQRSDDPREAVIQLQNWMETTDAPQVRKSLEALLESSPIRGILWDYKTLCEAHEARGGVWA